MSACAMGSVENHRLWCTWQPIFDGQPTGSIGAVAVAQSDPNIVYVGSGEGLHRPDLSVGDGIYKSTDAGKSWNASWVARWPQKIPQLAVDPRDANKVFAAVAGHPYGLKPGARRVPSTMEATEKVLDKDENTGASDVLIESCPFQHRLRYALGGPRRPMERAWMVRTAGFLNRSTEEKHSSSLPAGFRKAWRRRIFAISASNPKVLFASVATKEGVKLYRTEDAGANWAITTNDPSGRPNRRRRSCRTHRRPERSRRRLHHQHRHLEIHRWRKNLDRVPRGSRRRRLPEHLDQSQQSADHSARQRPGRDYTVNGGETWSSWYNQSTAQMYHVNADNSFPYRLLQRPAGERVSLHFQPRQ